MLPVFSSQMKRMPTAELAVCAWTLDSILGL